MTVEELRPGLWRWTCRHPAWTPDEGGPEGWAPEVGCVYCETPDAIVLIDPLLPVDRGDRERFLAALDRDVDRLRFPVAVLVTVSCHTRSVAEIHDRYPRWNGGTTPSGIHPLVTGKTDEVAYWMPARGVLVTGDVLLGDGAGGLRICPDAWLKLRGTESTEDVRRALLPWLDLPVETVLVSHGTPVYTGAHWALQAALA